jgi:hypothetical protein
MPDLGETIISLHNLKELGWEADLLQGVVNEVQGQHRIRIVNESRLDYINVIPDGNSEETVLLIENCEPRTPDTDPETVFLTAMDYHAMLGHPGIKATKDTLRKIQDIKVGDIESMDFSKSCHECIMGKMQNARKGDGTIHTVPEAKRPLQVITMDLMGPFKESPGGFKYVHGAVDLYSRKGFSENLESKDGVYE